MSDYKPTDEVRVTSSTGGQKGQKSLRFGGADPLARAELGRIYGFGEEKYARFNYLKGYDWSLSIDAMHRHMLAFEAGEDRDPESGLLHTAHVAWHGLTLTSFTLRQVGTDDRAPRLLVPRFIPMPDPLDNITMFLCGHSFGDEPTPTCGTMVHSGRFAGIPWKPTEDDPRFPSPQ